MNNAPEPNYYQILHVQPDAPVAIIKASYRALMQTLKQHPDLGGDHQHATQLNQAYQVLTDAEQRKHYDQQLNKAQQTIATTPSTKKPPSASSNCPFCHTPMNHQPHPLTAELSCHHCQSPLTTINSAAASDKYQRLIERLPKQASLKVYTTWPQTAITGQMGDLSPFGLRFLTASALPQGQIIKIDSVSLQAIARISYCQAQSEQCAIGVEFITLRFVQARGNFISLAT